MVQDPRLHRRQTSLMEIMMPDHALPGLPVIKQAVRALGSGPGGTRNSIRPWASILYLRPELKARDYYIQALVSYIHKSLRSTPRATTHPRGSADLLIC